jgi:SPP1 gp7 family putative phage head morphogenesis protein
MVLELMDNGSFRGEVPGRELHNAIIEKYAETCWAWGWAHGKAEVARLDRRRRFNNPPPAPRDSTPVEAIEWARSRVELQGRWHRSLDQKVNDLVVKALQEGWSNQQLSRELKAVFPTFSARRLETIARTETMSAYNQGRMAQFLGNAMIVAFQFSAILDTRTTQICSARNGKILVLSKISEAELRYNTPPLHYNCRSVLIPVDKFALEDLEAGDSAALEDFFDWTGPDGPRTLAEATNWKGLPDPLDGFGAGVVAPMPGNATPAQPPTQSLKDRVTQALGNSPGLPELKSAGAILRAEIQAGTGNHADKVLAVLKKVRAFGGGAPPNFQARSSTAAKGAILSIWRFIPDAWANKLAAYPVKARIARGRAYFNPKTRDIVLNGADHVTLHEVGHWIENVRGPRSFFEMSKRFLDDRTAGETAKPLRLLTGIRYRPNEVSKPDRFTDAYLGKQYRDSSGIYATEVLSMGLEAVFYQKHNGWADSDWIDFILGALVYCEP